MLHLKWKMTFVLKQNDFAKVTFILK